MQGKITAIIACVCGVLIFTSGVCIDDSDFVVKSTNSQTASVELNQPGSEIVSLGVFKLTAYCPCERCCGKTNGITASGVKAIAGVTVSADTNLLPFGTKLLLDDHEYIVQDRGGSIRGNRIDIYFDTHQEAISFGVQHKEIYKEKRLY